MKTEPEIRFCWFDKYDGRVTNARVEASVRQNGCLLFNHASVGTAVRDRQDRNRDELGEMIALGRALQRLGQTMERRAQGAVKHFDDMKPHQAAASERRAMGIFPGAAFSREALEAAHRRVSGGS